MNNTQIKQKKIADDTNQFDVAILGTGIAGSLLGAILARHNVRVVLIDEGTHPRLGAMRFCEIILKTAGEQGAGGRGNGKRTNKKS